MMYWNSSANACYVSKLSELYMQTCSIQILNGRFLLHKERLGSQFNSALPSSSCKYLRK